MATTTELDELVINKVDSKETYDNLKETGRVNPDELYFIEGGDVDSFSKISVGGTVISADSPEDTLTLTAGNNVTLTPNTGSSSITIAAKNTTYSNATSSADGLMSSEDKDKLDNLPQKTYYSFTTSHKKIPEIEALIGSVNIAFQLFFNNKLQ